MKKWRWTILSNSILKADLQLSRHQGKNNRILGSKFHLDFEIAPDIKENYDLLKQSYNKTICQIQGVPKVKIKVI